MLIVRFTTGSPQHRTAFLPANMSLYEAFQPLRKQLWTIVGGYRPKSRDLGQKDAYAHHYRTV